jgi:hypothetical protein
VAKNFSAPFRAVERQRNECNHGKEKDLILKDWKGFAYRRACIQHGQQP